MSSGFSDSLRASTRAGGIKSGSPTRASHRDPSPGTLRHVQHEITQSSTYSLSGHSSNAQITDNLRVQHQREKQELSELNDRFRGTGS